MTYSFKSEKQGRKKGRGVFGILASNKINDGFGK